jgi:TPR repeat protein
MMCVFLVLVGVAIRLPAQQTDADRKMFAEEKAKAEQGDATYQCGLGEIYDFGLYGVAKDYEEAVKWYRKAAEQNFALAQFDLGTCYSNGQGVMKDNVEAVKWYRKAADQNLAKAQYNLAVCYSNGQGVTKDYMEALKWYRKAAEQNDAPAQYNLGVCYYDGKGVEQDYVEAVKWFQKAADQGDAYAQCNLGVCYEKGNGVLKDYVEAIRWYRKAAENGRVSGQRALANCYAGGVGVPLDYVVAYKWYNLAAAQGDTNAINNRNVITRYMTPEQIADAQQLSREFKPRKESSSSNSTSPANPTVTGTGFFITDDGYLITNNHVVKDATKVRLLTSAGLIDAKVVQVDAANDLALLKAEGKFSPLPIASSRTVHLGNSVATVGFPNIGLQGFAPKLAKGEIASLTGAADDPRYFQISVPCQPGNSGGALVDERGNVIGIVSAKLDASAALAASGALPENVNYAVKSSFLLGFLESVPEVSTKLKAPVTADRKFEDVVKSAQDAAVLVLVY